MCVATWKLNLLLIITQLKARKPEVNSSRFEISNRFEKSFRLHGNFTTANLEISHPFRKFFRLHGDFAAVTFQTIVRFYCTCANDSF